MFQSHLGYMVRQEQFKDYVRQAEHRQAKRRERRALNAQISAAIQPAFFALILTGAGLIAAAGYLLLG